MTFENKRLAGIILGIVLLLMVPLVAMQFTTEVKWSLLDFTAAGILLLSTGVTIEIVLRKVKSARNRILLCMAVLVALFLVWAELAVGIFGTPLAGS